MAGWHARPACGVTPKYFARRLYRELRAFLSYRRQALAGRRTRAAASTTFPRERLVHNFTKFCRNAHLLAGRAKLVAEP